MKYVYDKAAGQLVEKPEQRCALIEMLPVPDW
jgi:hypothetical protein